MTTILSRDVRAATFNFAADRNHGRRFSSFDPSVSDLRLVPKELPVRDARAVSPAPSLDVEGFAIAEHKLDDPRWFDEQWISDVYAPSCDALVKRLTGARECIQLYRPFHRIADDSARCDHAMTAGFVHIDFPRDAGEAQSRMYAEMAGKAFKKAAIYNVWKAISPAPQNRPLAVSDRRTVPEESFVIGMSVEVTFEAPYIILTPSEGIRFYYYPDMRLDESLIFLGNDFVAQNPLGCAHTAFTHPDGRTPRQSIESRVIAIFE